jgi:hypothetical protein
MTILWADKRLSRTPPMPDAADQLASPLVYLDDIWWQATDNDGIDWLLINVDGWSGSPESDIAMTRRALQHGNWASQGTYQARRIVLSGWLLAPDAGLLLDAINHLAAIHANALNQPVEFGVNEIDGVLKYLEVMSSQPALTVQYQGPGVAQVGMEFIAPWPIKAGPAQVTTTKGSTALAMNGNAVCRPSFVITGPATNPKIAHVEQGLHLGFNITLASTDQLFIDEATRTVLLNNTTNSRYVLTPDSAWFELQPGTNTIQYSDSSSNSGSLDIHWSDAWW